MLTGDNEKTAKKIAESIGIDNVIAMLCQNKKPNKSISLKKMDLL